MWVRRIPLVAVVLLVLGHDAVAGLIGHWTFDEGSGTVAKDASGQGHDGQLVDGPRWTAGLMGDALEFDGVKARIDVPYWPGLTPTQGTTITVWVFPKDTSRSCIVGQFEGYGMALMDNLRLKSVVWGGDWVLDNVGIPQAEWSHISMTWDVEHSERLIFLNGEVVGTRPDSVVPAVQNDLGIGLWIGWPDAWGDDSFTGLIDDVRMYDHILTPEEIMDAMRGSGPGLAREPEPEDKATDVPADTVLAWEPGEFAATHDVYLGVSFDDVNDAGRDDPRSVLAGEGQTDARYDPDGLLEYGQTYYWRIDEVNAAPDNTIFKGQIWSFTVEPFGYPITGVTATASSFQPGMGPENTINGSGLDDLDQHSTEATQMWMTDGAKPAWIQFEFDKVYKLHELWVWNSNQVVESFLGFGAKEATIEVSEDGEAWTALEGVPEFAQAPGTPTYTANTTVDLGGAMGKFVRLTIDANWGGLAAQTGLAEVRFFYVPVQAFKPQPADDATDVSRETDLSWRPGREATSHVAYLGTDAAAVADGAASSETPADHVFTPADLLFATEYFWRVDEVGDAGTHPGDVWSFTTAEYAVIDDFESYTDDVEAEATIWHTWIDGLTTGASGSQVGYDVAPFAERAIVHGGRQSMPLRYNNESSPFYSEAEREFSPARDWTVGGADSLSLWVRGDPAADGSADLYVVVEDSAGNTGMATNATAVTSADWALWTIPQADLAGVDMTRVEKMRIGVGNRASPAPGGAGIVYIDDIGYGRPLASE